MGNGSIRREKVGYTLRVPPQRFGNFVLLDTLGRGGMGDVHLARALPEAGPMPSPLVLKRLLDVHSGNQTFVQRFRHEAELAICVDSAYVAKVYDAGAADGQPYIAMELIEGQSLLALLIALSRSRARPPVEAVIDLFVGSLAGLAVLHEARHPTTGDALQIVHRDLSPKNLMIRNNGDLCLIDLGIGKSQIQAWKTSTGMVLGTMGYLSPEQATALPLDLRSDLYSMGIVLFEMLTLQRYFEKGTRFQMLMAQARPTFRPAKKFRSELPDAFDDLLQRALAVEPEDRFQTAEEMTSALRELFPESTTQGKGRALLHLVLGEEVTKQSAWIRSLMDLPLPKGAEEERTQTVVFARRPDLAHIAGKHALASASTEDPALTPVQPVPLTSSGWIEVPPDRAFEEEKQGEALEESGPSPPSLVSFEEAQRELERRMALAHQEQNAIAAARRQRPLFVLAASAIAGGLVLVAVLLSSALKQSQPTVIHLHQASPEASEQPIRASARPKNDEEPTEEPPKPRPAPKRPGPLPNREAQKRAQSPLVPESHEPPVEPQNRVTVVTPATVIERRQSLTQRAAALRQRASEDEDLSRELNQLTARILMDSRATDPADALSRLKLLETELERLEKR